MQPAVGCENTFKFLKLNNATVTDGFRGAGDNEIMAAGR